MSLADYGSAPKQFTRGTHRFVSPEQTLERLRPLLPRMGITRLANVTGLDIIGLPVVMAVRPNSRSLAVSQGKGLTLAAAKASAAMESAEAFHAETVTGPLRLASYNELRAKHRVVDVERLPRMRDAVFSADTPMLWIEGQDWLNERCVWVPFHVVHTAHTTRMGWDLCGFSASSNGLASGNHLLEAASHAICEVVERDSSARARSLSSAERAAQRVDPESVDDPDCRTVLDLFCHAAVAVLIWNCTGPAGIAAFDVTIVDRDENAFRGLASFGGYGCHPVRAIALMRALTEAAQSRLTRISGSRDDMYRTAFDHVRQPGPREVLRALAAAPAPVSYRSVPDWQSDGFDKDVAWELERVRAAGACEAVVLPLTRPEFDIPVVRVVIPGMRVPEEAR